MTQPDYYDQGVDPAHDAFEADGVTPNAATLVLLSHTGTLDTTGHNGATDRVITRDGYDVQIGSDNSAASISEYLDPTIDPLTLPDGHVAAPVYDGPIY